MSSEETPAPLEENPYSVGTLTYTKRGLANVFIWILWGDLAYTIMELVFPRILKLWMLSAPGGPEGGLGASNTAVTWLTVIIPQILGVLICPAVSFRSDRCRSKWGRRIPYMLFTAPVLCMFLAGMGFSREISDYILQASWVAKLGISRMTVTLWAIGFFIVGFRVCYEVVGSVYWYLFADVVPNAFMGRFLGLFRVVSSLAGMGFGAFILPYSLLHMSWVHGGVALLYLVVFGLMCLKVKEGQYPPVTDVTEHTSVWEQIKIYMRECFSHRIYVFIFLGTGLFGISTLVALGSDVFAKDALGVSMKHIGYVTVVAGGLATLIMYPCGWLSDKFHPLRVTMVSLILIAAVNVLSCYFMRGVATYWVFTIIAVLLNGVYFAAGMPLLISLMPKTRFGQFCSANGTFKSAVLVVFGLFSGEFLDWLTNGGKLVDNYRYGFLCVGICFILYAITLVYVMKYWKQCGGMRGYIAPGVDEAVPAVAGPTSPSDDGATPRQE